MLWPTGTLPTALIRETLQFLSSGDNMGGECNSKCVKAIEEAYCVYIMHLCNIRENETSEGLQVFEFSEY